MISHEAWCRTAFEKDLETAFARLKRGDNSALSDVIKAFWRQGKEVNFEQVFLRTYGGFSSLRNEIFDVEKSLRRPLDSQAMKALRTLDAQSFHGWTALKKLSRGVSPSARLRMDTQFYQWEWDRVVSIWNLVRADLDAIKKEFETPFKGKGP